MKNVKLFLLALTTFSTIALSYSVAEAGCFASSKLISQDVKITPPSNCLSVTLSDDTCGGQIEVRFINDCDAQISVEGRETFTATLESMSSVTDSVDEFKTNSEEMISYTATMGEQTFDIDVTFNATLNEEEGCSTSGKSGSSIFFLLGFGFFLLRRRDKRRA